MSIFLAIKEDTMGGILDDFFNKPSEDSDTEEVFKIGGEDFDDKEFSVEIPELTGQEMGNIRIMHGWHGNDYVWHISTKHHKIAFRTDPVEPIARCMNEVVPPSIEVKIWLPLADWDIQEYTFKAIELKACWQISQKSLDALNIKIFTLLNSMI